MEDIYQPVLGFWIQIHKNGMKRNNVGIVSRKNCEICRFGTIDRIENGLQNSLKLVKSGEFWLSAFTIREKMHIGILLRILCI